MITRSYHPLERGRPAVWVEAIERGMTPRIMRRVRDLFDDGPVDVVVDSAGGACAEGVRLYDALKQHPAPKRVTVLKASSMASVVAMAGDVIRIVEGGTFFLHPPGYGSSGLVEMSMTCRVTSSDLRTMADRLDAADEHHLDIYVRRTGLGRDALRAMSAAETTLDAETAVRLGFADEVVPWPV